MDFYFINHEATLDDIKNFKYPNQKIGVIVHIENEDGEILLQQRGIKSNDENGLYEDIGGKLEIDDHTFKDAIEREIKEETGEDINLKIGNSIGIFHCYKNNINWIFIIYPAKYIGGDIKIMEPDKCTGYKFFTYANVMNSDLVTESCKFITEKLSKNTIA